MANREATAGFLFAQRQNKSSIMATMTMALASARKHAASLKSLFNEKSLTFAAVAAVVFIFSAIFLQSQALTYTAATCGLAVLAAFDRLDSKDRKGGAK